MKNYAIMLVITEMKNQQNMFNETVYGKVFEFS